MTELSQTFVAKSEREPVLPDRDKEEIERSAEVLLRKLLENYPDDLPDAIVFPDKSARSLVYLVDSVLSETAKSRGVKKPSYFFMHPENTGKDLVRLRDELALEEEILRQLVSEGHGHSRRAKLAREFINFSEEDIPKAENSQQLLLERASEVKKFASKEIDNNDPEIIIFDEYIMTGRTVEALRRAFGYQVPFYALIANQEYVADTEDEDVYWGEEDQHYPRDMYDRPTGFDYRVEKPQSSGVIEDEHAGKYIKLDTNRSTDDVIQIREEMREIGDRVAERLVTQK